MAYYFDQPSRTFGEYLLVPGYSSSECVPDAVSLKTPLVKYRKGQEDCPLTMNIPMISAIMQSVSGPDLAIALAKQGGVSFIFGSQSIESEAEMVRKVKSYKKGFVTSDSNLKPSATLADVLALKEKTGHSTVAVTEDGTAHGKLVGIVASRDYRISRMALTEKVADFMTPLDKLVIAPDTTTLKEANDIIWDNKINSLPLVDENGCLKYMVFRKDYDSHKENVNELLDAGKSYVVGAGINTRDYAERVPALVEAGVDVLCIDSSEGFTEWQSRTIDWIRAHYSDKVKVGAGNVVASGCAGGLCRNLRGRLVSDPAQYPGGQRGGGDHSQLFRQRRDHRKGGIPQESDRRPVCKTDLRICICQCRRGRVHHGCGVWRP